MSSTHLSHSPGDLPMDLPIHVRTLHDRLLAARARQRKADFELALLLAEMAEGPLFLELGYASLANYAEQVLELPPRTTRELVSLARRVSGLPVTSARLESGELDWTKAREIVRVATPDTEAAWVERAAGVTSRVLEAEVATALFGDMPPTGAPDPERRPERQRVVFEMDSADAEVLRTALSAIRAATHVGDSGASDRATDSVILAGIARAALVALEADKVLTGERYVVVLEHCPDCRRTVSPESEVSDSAAAEAFCDAEVVEMRPGPEQGHLTRSVPETTRRKVFHRAHWKCEVPGCRNRLWLDIHHMRPRADGGRHGFENLAAVCCAHHRRIHEGTLGVELKCEVVGPESGQVRRVIEVTYGDGRRSRTGG